MLDCEPPYSTPALAPSHLLVPGGHVGCTPTYTTVQLSAAAGGSSGRQQQHLVGVEAAHKPSCSSSLLLF